MTSYAVVGGGWRAEFYIRLGLLAPERFEFIGAVVRNAERTQTLHEDYGIPTFESLSRLLKFKRPDFVVVAVSWDSNPEVVEELVKAGVPVLCETPPAPTDLALREMWNAVGESDLVHVAEQYLRLPGHAAKLVAINEGLIGTPTSVEISSTHGYHAVSMMRGFLQAGFEPCQIRANKFDAPLVDPLSRDGWSENLEAQMRGTTISTIDFGNGKSGLYNFVDNQWHNQLRHRRLVIRGSKGEIVDDKIISLGDGPSIVKSSFERYQLGYDLNLDGFDTEHISLNGKVIYRNPFVGLRFMDEEIAISTLLTEMALWVSGSGDGPYPLREACQDQLISLAIAESLELGTTVQTQRELWAK